MTLPDAPDVSELLSDDELLSAYQSAFDAVYDAAGSNLYAGSGMHIAACERAGIRAVASLAANRGVERERARLIALYGYEPRDDAARRPR